MLPRHLEDAMANDPQFSNVVPLDVSYSSRRLISHHSGAYAHLYPPEI